MRDERISREQKFACNNSILRVIIVICLRRYTHKSIKDTINKKNCHKVTKKKKILKRR